MIEALNRGGRSGNGKAHGWVKTAADEPNTHSQEQVPIYVTHPRVRDALERGNIAKTSSGK